MEVGRAVPGAPRVPVCQRNLSPSALCCVHRRALPFEIVALIWATRPEHCPGALGRARAPRLAPAGGGEGNEEKEQEQEQEHGLRWRCKDAPVGSYPPH